MTVLPLLFEALELQSSWSVRLKMATKESAESLRITAKPVTDGLPVDVVYV